MARICIEQKWYEQVEPSTFFEIEFEDRISLHSPSIYPHYHVVPFKKKLITPDENSKSGITQVAADLAFISKDYKEWWVVEVEMGYHDFKGHVEPQIEQLLNASYGQDEAEYLSGKLPQLDSKLLTKLIKENKARLLLIVNQSKSDWIKNLQGLENVVVAVFELFRSDTGDEIFRVNGKYPSILTDKISSCSFHPTIPRILGVDNPNDLNIPNSQIVKLLYNDCVTEWRRIQESGQIWLTAINRNPLNSNDKYEIYKQNDGQLVLRKSIELGAKS